MYLDSKMSPKMSPKNYLNVKIKRDIEYLQSNGFIIREGGRKEGHWKILKNE